MGSRITSVFFLSSHPKPNAPSSEVLAPMLRPHHETKTKEGVTKLRAMKLPKAAELVESRAYETMAYYAFPSNHWRQLRTTRWSGSSARSDVAPVSLVHSRTVTRR